MRLERLLNLGAQRVEPVKVDHMSRTLCPPAATHLALTFAKHLFEVEPSLCPLLTLTFSPRRVIPAAAGSRAHRSHLLPRSAISR